jgi:hypothetical protein
MRYPAKHSEDARNDKIAIARVTDWITTSGYAVPNLESYDTWPNYDGPIDLIDEEGYIKGTIFVQVKKLPKENHLKYGFDDKGKFLAYCKKLAAWTIILFIGVDFDKNCAYWLHMSEGLLNQLGNSQTIHFDENQIFNADIQESIRSWHVIAARYADIAHQRNELEAQVRMLLQKTESNLIGVDRPEFINLHTFLDEHNRFLDQDFNIVKKIYYPNIWKLGIAYAEYGPNILSYFLYPIRSTVNDAAIKKLNPAVFKPLKAAPDGSTWFPRSNPIEKNPYEHAKVLVRKRLDSILAHKLLDHSGTVTLAREYLFAYVDKYSVQLGLSTKDSYTINELEAAFVNYYPRWLFTAGKILENRGIYAAQVRGSDVINPDMMLYNPEYMVAFVSDDTTRQEIQQQVAAQIAANAPVPLIAIIGDKLSPAIFARMLEYVKQKGLTKVARLYKPKDVSHLNGAHPVFAWDMYSPAAHLYNVKRVAVRLEHVYNKIISNNFPQISQQLTLVEPGHRRLFVYDNAKHTSSSGFPPDTTTIYEVVANKIHLRKSSTFLLASEHTIAEKQVGSKWILSIDGTDYELISRSGATFDIWSTDTPLLDMIYTNLKQRVNNYFKQISLRK